jgi:hypothetical protein
MPDFYGRGHRRFGHGFGHHGFGHGAGRWHRRWPWLRRPDEPSGPPPDGDGDGDVPSPLPFPPFLEIGETEARQHHRRHQYRDDREMGLNDEPIEARDEDAQRRRRRGRWVRSKGKLILFGV